MVIALAGNKADVREGRAVPADEANAYAADAGIICMDTSAKTGLNVKEVFVQIGARRRVGWAGEGVAARGGQPMQPPPRCRPLLLRAAKKLPRSAKGREKDAVADLAAAKPAAAAAGGGCCG